MNQSLLADRLAGIVGQDHVVTGERCSHYAVDGKVPTAAVFPATVEDLSEVMKVAASERLSVVPWGGGTKIGLGNMPVRVDLVVGLARLNRIIDHEPADLTATFQGGALLGELQAYLGQKGQFLPLDPPLPQRATIGGILAANSSGPRRLRYGAPRDLVIGIRVVHADGRITKGGAKVVKNVTGYDMNKLYIGSLGTLGIIVEATFRIFPLPAMERTWLASFPTGEAAASAVAQIMASTIEPSRIELLSPAAARSVAGQVGVSLPRASVALASSVGSVPEAVDAQIVAIGKICAQSGSDFGTPLDGGGQEMLWAAIADFPSPNGTDRIEVSLRASILLTKVIETIRRAEEIARSAGLESVAISEAGSGIVRLHWRGDGGSPEETSAAMARGIEAFRRSIMEGGGSLVVLAAPPAVKANVDVWGPVGAALPVMLELKGQFDPQKVLNPGRFVGGI